MIEFPRLWLRRTFSLSGAVLALLVPGCSKPQITSYSAPKELAPEVAMTPGTNANDQFAPVPRAPVTWKTPAGWQESPGDQMRVASFSMAGEGAAKADVTVIPLPTMGETNLQNVNRWRGQLGLPPMLESDLPTAMSVITIDQQPARFFEIGSPVAAEGKKRILVAQQRRGDVEWYVKMTGDDALVRTQRAAFLEFAQSLRFGGSALPEGWREIAPGPMQAAKYQTASGAEVTVAKFPGDVGGVLANVNRWRKQLQLPPITEAEVAAQTHAEAGGTLADFTSADATQRLVAVIVPHESETVFYKMTGPPAIVETERARFVQFVESAQ